MTTQLKIGYVLKRFPRLSETFILNELLELERQGVEVEVFSLKRPLHEPRHARLAELKARVHYVSNVWSDDASGGSAPTSWSERMERLVPGKSDADRLALTRKSFQIARLTRAAGISHLHAHFASDATTAALVAAREADVPFSFTAHARDIYHCYVSREVDDAARREKIGAARFVVTVSDYNRRHLENLTRNVSGARVIRLYNGIDLRQFAPDIRVAGSPNTILTVGRLIEKKGYPDLIDACRLLREKGIAFTCNIIGEGPLRDEIAGRIAEAGLQGSVNLLGARDHNEVVTQMRQSSLMVLPCVVSASGDQDGLPTVLLEALAVGLPAVSTRVAGIPEIIENGQTGLLVEPNRPDQLAAAMARILNDGELRRSLAFNGHLRAVERFNLSTNVARLRDLFMQSAHAAANLSSGEDDAYRVSIC